MRLRRAGWRRNLIAMARQAEGQPFSWGLVDCPHLVSAALEIQVGQALVIPDYDDAAGARAAAEAIGRDAISELARQYPESTTRPAAFAQHGDIIIATGADDLLLNLHVFVDRHLLGVEIGGTVYLRSIDSLHPGAVAWRVSDDF